MHLLPSRARKSAAREHPAARPRRRFSRSEAIVVAYILREHEKGRHLSQILQDPIIVRLTTPDGRGRLLEDPRLVRHLYSHRHDAAADSAP